MLSGSIVGSSFSLSNTVFAASLMSQEVFVIGHIWISKHKPRAVFTTLL